MPQIMIPSGTQIHRMPVSCRVPAHEDGAEEEALIESVSSVERSQRTDEVHDLEAIDG